MSMLSKILEDMYVEPELLDELDEEQKQILFCKMRQEQLRRWCRWDAQQPAADGRSEAAIRWLLGNDGRPWVWVMGEHSDDRSMEQILEDEARDTARQRAAAELDSLRGCQELVLKEQLRAEALDDGDEGDDAAPSTSELAESLHHLDAAGAASPRVDEDQLLHQLATTSAADDNVDEERRRLERRVQEEADRRIAEEEERRSAEIYQSIKEAREAANREAELEAEREKLYWQRQAAKAREAEDQVRAIARRARELHVQQTRRTSTTLLGAVDRLKAPSPSEAAPPLLKLARPPKPDSRQAIVAWFVKGELPLGAGLDPKTTLVAAWFHGIIGRVAADRLLSARPVGSFLARISERIWGYTLSYSQGVAAPPRHFLIERVAAGYQFLGTNQVVHSSLWDLVSYHESVPITPKGKEVLLHAVGQDSIPEDYKELFQNR